MNYHSLKQFGNLEKMAMNELNYREFGTAEHTREWW